MKRLEGLRTRSPLARRLILWTVLFSSAITLVTTGAQLWRDYQGDLSEIEANFVQIRDVHLSTLAESLWATGRGRLKIQLDGMLKLRDMHYLVLREGAETWAEAGTLTSRNVIARDFPVTHLHRGELRPIGTLTAVATLDGMYARLLDEAVVVLVGNAVKTFLVAAFMLGAVHWLITRHVLTLASQVRFEGRDEPFALARAPKPGTRADELDELVAALNVQREHVHRAIAALSTERARFQNVFEHANDAIFILDLDGGLIRDVNRVAEQRYGYTREEFRGLPVVALSAPGHEHEVQGVLQRLRQEGHAVFERVHRTQDGRSLHVEVSSRVFEWGGQKLVVSHVRDVGERLRAAEALRASEEQLINLIANLPGYVYRVKNDPDYTPVYISEGVVRVTGYAQREYLVDRSITCGAELHPDDRDGVWQIVQQAVDQHQAYECEYRLFTKTGQLRWVWERGRGIYDANGRLAFLEGFVTNVTDSKHAQEERETLLKELTARHVEMESFVYTVSHDLKSPLITIGGFAQLLEKDLALGDSARAAEDLAEIQKAQAHMQTLIADLLALSKSGRPTGTMEPVDLRQLVQDALAHCQGALNGAHARVTQADRWPTVRADRGRLFQALQNLIDNAAKFRRADADLSIDLGWTVADGELRLHVRDNGRGVAPEYHERIFGLFERLEPGVDGTGVGLAIAKRVVEAHGGRLWVESTPNTGSCFFIGLPVSAMVSSGSTTTLQN